MFKANRSLLLGLFLRGGVLLGGVLLGGVLLGGLAAAQTLDDPTRPTSTTLKAPPKAAPAPPAQAPRFTPDDFNLAETYLMGTIRRARINGAWYHIGDRLRDGVIQEIDATHVTVATSQRLYVLSTKEVRAIFSIIEEPQ
ncbi:MAG: hypothetical protein WED11_01665 [Natronospirillum sp.]